jgi:hypothetical protein
MVMQRALGLGFPQLAHPLPLFQLGIGRGGLLPAEAFKIALIGIR